MKVELNKEDEISRELRKNSYCRTVLYDMISSVGYGQHQSFNKPGYVAAILDRYYLYEDDKTRNNIRGKIVSVFEFLEKHGLVLVDKNGISINKEKVPKYVPKSLHP